MAWSRAGGSGKVSAVGAASLQINYTPTTPGRLLTCTGSGVCYPTDSAAPISSIVDSNSTTWTLKNYAAQWSSLNHYCAGGAYLENAPTSITYVTLTFPVSVYGTWAVDEWAGYEGATGLFQTAEEVGGFNSNTTNTTQALSAVAPSDGNSLVLYSVGSDGGAAQTWTNPPTGGTPAFTEIFQQSADSNHMAAQTFYHVRSNDTSSQTATVGYTGNAYGWIWETWVFKPASAAAPDQIYPEFPVNIEASEPADVTGLDAAPFDWYADNFTAQRNDADTVVAERLPDSFEWEDVNDSEEFYPVAWAQAPPIPDVLPDQPACEYIDNTLEDVDEDFGFAAAPLPDPNEVAASILYDADEQLEEDEFLEADQTTPLSPDFTPDQIWGEFSDAQLGDEDEFLEGFSLDPLPADNDVGIRPEFPDQSEEPEDEDFAFSTVPQPEDVQSDQVFTEFPAQGDEPEDEDFTFHSAPAPGDVVPDTASLIPAEDGTWIQETDELIESEQYAPLPDDVIPPPVVGRSGMWRAEMYRLYEEKFAQWEAARHAHKSAEQVERVYLRQLEKITYETQAEFEAAYRRTAARHGSPRTGGGISPEKAQRLSELRAVTEAAAARTQQLAQQEQVLHTALLHVQQDLQLSAGTPEQVLAMLRRRRRQNDLAAALLLLHYWQNGD